LDHYQVLQVRRDAEPEVIERAYKALSLKYHPDVVAPGKRQAATKRMQDLNEAYRVLKDPKLRRRYNVTLPAEGAERGAWDEFWEKGLVGIFFDRYRSRI
jgi:DnaJ-class molecular chaperone